MLQEEQENKNLVITKIERYLKEIAELSKVISIIIPVHFCHLQHKIHLTIRKAKQDCCFLGCNTN
jgi:hypothetical protein